MDDSQIIDLYWKRQENAVPETKRNMGGTYFLSQIIFWHNMRILRNA